MKNEFEFREFRNEFEHDEFFQLHNDYVVDLAQNIIRHEDAYYEMTRNAYEDNGDMTFIIALTNIIHECKKYLIYTGKDMVCMPDLLRDLAEAAYRECQVRESD